MDCPEKIKKRDGRIVAFDKNKIVNAIWAAAQAVGGTDKEMSDALANKVISKIAEKFKSAVPSVEDVQDMVERVLIENGHATTAKEFILYRQQHAKMRAAKSVFVEVQETMGEYLDQKDWRVKENSNEDYSFSGLMMHISGKIVANYTLTEIYSPAIADAHKKGYYHIHDLSHGIVGYCAGWSLKNLLVQGFGNVANKVDAKPAKHMNTAIHQMVNFLGCLQMEFAGAQAFSSVDTLLAPFVRADNLTYKEVKQSMQELVYSLNIPSRWGCFSDDTEILTDNGWKKGIDLDAGDIIATLNMNRNRIEYKPVLAMTKYPYKGEMINLRNRVQDQLITPDHKVLRKIHNFQKGVSENLFVLEEAQNLKTKIPLIPLGALFDGIEKTYVPEIISGNFQLSDSHATPFPSASVAVDLSAQMSAHAYNSACHDNSDNVRLLAWIVAEGSLPRDERIVIYQSQNNEKKCNEIREILRNLNIGFYEQLSTSGYTGKKNCVRFRINRIDSRRLNKAFFENGKRIPVAIKNMNSHLCRAFIDTYIKGDGHEPTNRIVTKHKETVDDLQEIIVKAGWGSTHYKTKKGLYVIRVIKHPTTTISKINKVYYEGLVWCPTTVNKTVVARRNGKVFLSGNCQMPFTNITFDWTVPEDMKNEYAVVGGKMLESKYGDYQKEMDMINRAFLEVMLEGDAKGRIFTFPIPTYNITKEFNWDSENAKILFEVTAKYGTPYFQNYIGSGLDPKSIRAMCCRLNINLAELRSRGNGLFGAGEQTGSIGVVTLNMNRLGYEAKGRGKEEFFRMLKYYMVLAKDSLETKREVIEKNLKNGLMPYTKAYLGTFRNHFSTIGLCGMNEACMNFLGKDIATPEGKAFTIEAMQFMQGMLREFQAETGNLYNLEATPAESTAYRLARADKKMYPDIITAGTGQPYLTNSTHLPVNYSDNAIFALRHQNDIQPHYTGGTVFHTFLGEKVSTGAGCMALVKKIAKNTKLPYFSITPTFSVCKEHGYIVGEKPKCPRCSAETEVYTRIVGYFRPTKNWNPGKREEFKDRLEYSENKTMATDFEPEKPVMGCAQKAEAM